jgi:hypothetical protein
MALTTELLWNLLSQQYPYSQHRSNSLVTLLLQSLLPTPNFCSWNPQSRQTFLFPSGTVLQIMTLLNTLNFQEYYKTPHNWIEVSLSLPLSVKSYFKAAYGWILFSQFIIHVSILSITAIAAVMRLSALSTDLYEWFAGHISPAISPYFLIRFLFPA